MATTARRRKAKPQTPMTPEEFHLMQAKAMREDPDLRDNVRDLALKLGIDCAYHTHDSRRSEPGFPDWVFVGRGVLWRELKAVGNTPTPEQAKWLYRLKKTGQDVDVWTPVDWFSGRIRRELSAIALSPMERRIVA